MMTKTVISSSTPSRKRQRSSEEFSEISQNTERESKRRRTNGPLSFVAAVKNAVHTVVGWFWPKGDDKNMSKRSDLCQKSKEEDEVK